MGLGTFLLRMGFYSGIVSIPLYFYAQGDGFKQGQIDGFRKGYTQCKTVVEKVIDKSYTTIEKSYERIDGLCDEARLSIDDLLKEKEKLKKTTTLTDNQIEGILEIMEQNKTERVMK